MAVHKSGTNDDVELVPKLLRQIGALGKIDLMELSIDIFLISDVYHARADVGSDDIPKAFIVKSLANKACTATKIEHF